MKARFDELKERQVIREDGYLELMFTGYRNDQLAEFIVGRVEEEYDEDGDPIGSDLVFDDLCDEVSLTRSEVERCDL